MTDGPGPKEPPFIQRAFEAVEAAITAPVEVVDSTIQSAIEQAHDAERAALAKVQDQEKAAAAALESIAASVGDHVKVLAQRFPSIVANFRAVLSRL